MAKTPEKRVKDAVVKILKEAGVYYFFPVASGYGSAGIPDIVCCVNGLFLGIECKANGGKPTALQVREGKRIFDAGGEFMVVDEHGLEFLPAVIKRLQNRKQ